MTNFSVTAEKETNLAETPLPCPPFQIWLKDLLRVLNFSHTFSLAWHSSPSILSLVFSLHLQPRGIKCQTEQEVLRQLSSVVSAVRLFCLHVALENLSAVNKCINPEPRLCLYFTVNQTL